MRLGYNDIINQRLFPPIFILGLAGIALSLSMGQLPIAMGLIGLPVLFIMAIQSVRYPVAPIFHHLHRELLFISGNPIYTNRWYQFLDGFLDGPPFRAYHHPFRPVKRYRMETCDQHVYHRYVHLVALLPRRDSEPYRVT